MSLRKVFNYVGHLFYGLDLFGNTVVGGDPRSTISGNCGAILRKMRKPQCYLCGPLCWVLERPWMPAPFGPGHCDRTGVDEGLIPPIVSKD